jgi:hypothetical protein
LVVGVVFWVESGVELALPVDFELPEVDVELPEVGVELPEVGVELPPVLGFM